MVAEQHATRRCYGNQSNLNWIAAGTSWFKTTPSFLPYSRIRQHWGSRVILNSTWTVRGISQVKYYIWMKRNTRSKPSFFQLSVFSVLTQSVCFDSEPCSSHLTFTTFHSDWHCWHVADPLSPWYGYWSKKKNTLPRRAVFSEIVSYRMFWQAGRSVNVCRIAVIATAVALLFSQCFPGLTRGQSMTFIEQIPRKTCVVFMS